MASDPEDTAPEETRKVVTDEAFGARFAWLARLRHLLELGGADEATRDKLDKIAAFVGRVAIGAATQADWGRLDRMHATLRDDQPLRVEVMESIEHARRWPDVNEAANNLRATLTWKVDEKFSKLETGMVREALASKNGPIAVAVALSSACGAFGDRPPKDRLDRKRLWNTYDSAWRRLRVPPTK